MSFLDLRSDVTKRKLPRLYLATMGDVSSPLPDVFLTWPDRANAQVLDLSESGLVVSSLGMVGQRKSGQVLQVKLRVGGTDPQPLTVKVTRMTSGAVFLALEGMTAMGRLRLDQDERESLIRASWKNLAPQTLHTSFENCEWWHSAFDTNIWIWRDSALATEKMIIEFESVALVYDSAGSRYLKSPSSLDETKGYVGAFTMPLPNRVEPGHNWSERLQKVLATSLPAKLLNDLMALVPRNPVKGTHV